MTIKDINSESWCRKAYISHQRGINSMNLTNQEYNEIRQVWSHKLASWDATVANDENEYDFEDSDYTNYKKEGAEEAEKDTGYDGDNTGMISRGTGDALFGLGGGIWNMFTGGFGSLGNLKNIDNFGKGSMTKSAKKTMGGKKHNWSTYVQAAMAIATAAMYLALKPNKEQVKACNTLQQGMEGSQKQLIMEQDKMEKTAEETNALSDEANERNEEGNDEIAEKKAEYDLFMEQYLAIKEKIDSGEELTDSEKQLYKDLVGILSEIGVEIDEISETTGDEVEDLYDEIGESQEVYDVVAESMGQIEGLTDYAESFDETTRIMCYIEAVAQTFNSISGFMAGAKLMATGFWNWVLGAASIAAGGISAAGAYEQFDMAKQVGVEIGMREDTQDLNSETMGIYEDEIDGFDAILQGVEDLELDIPEDVSAPEETTVPAGSSSNTTAGTTDTNAGGTTGTGGTNGNSGTTGTGDANNTNGTGGANGAGGTTGAGGTGGTNNANPTSRDYVSTVDIIRGDLKTPEIEYGSEGKVIVSSTYATAITKGLGIPNAQSGNKFDSEKIPNILSFLIRGFSVDDIKNVMNGGSLKSSYKADVIETLTGEDTGVNTTVNNSEKYTAQLRKVINYYKPILTRASSVGWTTG